MEDKYSKIAMGMGDHSRLALCAFMVGLLAFNPFSTFLGNFMSDYSSPDYSTRFDQRRILSDDLGEINRRVISTMLCKKNFYLQVLVTVTV